MMKMAKYKTFKDLCIKTDRSELHVIVDNDDVSFYDKKSVCLYSVHPDTLVFEALEMLHFTNVEEA
jgi:hypothetical protein